MTLREPLGVIGGIIPWNYPLLQAVWKIAPVIAAGNTVVLKPAEQACLSVMYLGRLSPRRNSAGVVNIVPGFGAGAGAALVDHHMVAKIMFTGSPMTGKRIAAQAANTLKPVGLELGGKSAVIVYEDAPVDQAAQVAAMRSSETRDRCARPDRGCSCTRSCMTRCWRKSSRREEACGWVTRWTPTPPWVR